MSLSRRIADLRCRVEGAPPRPEAETSAAGGTPPEAGPPIPAPPRPREGRLRRWAFRILKACSLVALVGAFAAGTLYWYYARDLPDIRSLSDYRPPQTTRVVSRDGVVVAEFFRQRRTVVPLDEIPQVLIHAVVAAEDDRFYEHEGIDYAGIFRAAVKNLLAMRVKEGASTITQQVVKTFLLTPRRDFSRKFRELILARRLEQNLSKDEILYLYLNQIYFGHGRYGVEEAARYYFGKPVRQLTLPEAALIAGLPKAPETYSPRKHPARARKRRHYVLHRMAEVGFISEEEARLADATPIELAPPPPEPVGAWYVEEVRRRLAGVLGEDRLLEGGLTIEIAMDARLQASAEKALRAGLEAVARRQGWRGPIGRLSDTEIAQVLARFHRRATRLRERGGVWLLDLSGISTWKRDAEGPPLPPLQIVPYRPGRRVAGIVAEVDGDGRRAQVSLGDAVAELRFEDAKWARPFSPERPSPAPRSFRDLIRPGDVVWVRLSDPKGGAQPSTAEEPDTPLRLPGQLTQRPLVEGALVAIEPQSREVVALVGGYEYDGGFNRATQARRQPGSSFKPYVYGAAIESGRWTIASTVLDARAVFRDPWTGKTWKPENFGGRYDGAISLATALARSKNVVSVRLVEALGVDAVIDFARRAGIQSRLPRYLPLALGAGEVFVLEQVNAYATIAAGGVYDSPVLVRRVLDQKGRPLLVHEPSPEQRISPEVSYVLTQLMRKVMTDGTGRRLQIGRPAAGKTGTANDQRDAWFVGFTPDLVCGVWVGFDEPRPLGPHEYGGVAAGPIWKRFMEAAHEGRSKHDFSIPPSVVFVRIDPDTGLIAPPEQPGTYLPFVPGTEPTEYAPPPGTLDPGEFFIADPESAPGAVGGISP